MHWRARNPGEYWRVDKGGPEPLLKRNIVN